MAGRRLTPIEPFDRALHDTFVRPFYLQLLGGNFTRADEAEASSFRPAIATAATAISDGEIARLLSEREWRGRLSAAWFVGLSNRTGFVPMIGKLLLASEVVYAGGGYCVALGIIGGEECAGRGSGIAGFTQRAQTRLSTPVQSKNSREELGPA